MCCRGSGGPGVPTKMRADCTTGPDVLLPRPHSAWQVEEQLLQPMVTTPGWLKRAASSHAGKGVLCG